jgi:hypothetical protein
MEDEIGIDRPAERGPGAKEKERRRRHAVAPAPPSCRIVDRGGGPVSTAASQEVQHQAGRRQRGEKRSKPPRDSHQVEAREEQMHHNHPRDQLQAKAVAALQSGAVKPGSKLAAE